MIITLRTKIKSILNDSYAFLALMILQLQMWDALITQIFVKNKLVQEFNPLAMHMVENGYFLYFKVPFLFLSVILLWKLNKILPSVARIAGIAIIIFYGIVLMWNFTVFSSIYICV